MDRNLVEYVGGLEASIKALEVLRQHKNCCDFWDMFNIYGKGRASRTVKDRELAVANNLRLNMFNLEALERAVELELNKHLTTIGGHNKVVYNEPIVLPRRLFGAGCSGYWEASPKLLLKYEKGGETYYVTGEYHFKTYEGGIDEFRLDGHNGNWSQFVTGWAYV